MLHKNMYLTEHKMHLALQCASKAQKCISISGREIFQPSAAHMLLDIVSLYTLRLLLIAGTNFSEFSENT